MGASFDFGFDPMGAGLGDATATVDIDADGFVTVDKGGEVFAGAYIDYRLHEGLGPKGVGLLEEPEPPADADLHNFVWRF